MTSDVETILRHTRNQLRELGEIIQNLVIDYPDVFDDTEIQKRLEAFRRAYQESTYRLENPSLSIAMIGTTSSGKSTIVNALIGRKVAPMEAGEMSGGVLTLRHSNERKLVVEETEAATWETGTWSGLSDEVLYEKIRNGVMFPYHDTRKKKDCMAPRVTVSIPLLPASDRNLLGLPSGVGVELIDLPGLKSIQDRDNLKVIQERVHKAFSLVALDYMQVDDEHRKRLLEELKRVVQFLQGRTDSMIFILNRVDQRGTDDIPISERINKLQKEIQETLSLKELPEILPFNARLLYYAQCAWGTGGIKQFSLVYPSDRLKLINAMFQDCAGTIRQHIGDNRDLRHRFRDVEDRVCDGENISDETMRQLLQYALDWSGGSKLWSRLRDRVQEAFPELVLLPALIEVFDNYDTLKTAIDTIASIRKIEQEEEVKAQQAKINDVRQNLHVAAKNLGAEFHSKTQEIINYFKTSDLPTISRILQQQEKEGYQGFQMLSDTVNEVEADLSLSLIKPVRDALKINQSAYELEEKLSEVISPVLAKDIAKAYDLVSRKLNVFTNNSGCMVKSVRDDDKEGKRELENAERAVRRLYQAMKEALTRRSEFVIQAQAQKLEEALISFINKQANELHAICFKQFPSLNLSEAILVDFKKNAFLNLLVLPEEFYKVSNSTQSRYRSKREKVGKKSETRTSTEGSCYKKEVTRTEHVDQWGDVSYQELSLPDADTMAQQWTKGVEKGKQGLWDVICRWLTTRLDLASSLFARSVDDVINLAERAFEEQLGIIEENFASEIQRWAEIESQKNLATEVRHKLEEKARTSYKFRAE